MTYDLVIAGGRVIDPASGLDGPADVAFDEGKVAAIGQDLRVEAREVIRAEGFVPLNFLSGGNFPDGSTWSERDATTDVILIGAQAAF